MRYQGIKVTMITGFLGAGKTTLIQHMLAQAPAYERWAVLVNEFGDIGLDAALLEKEVVEGKSLIGGGKHPVVIKEVPGGCVCCATSAAFALGLNQLIRQQNPDRIFIEPSGLGHPKQILQKLKALEYRDVLIVTGVFCVLDARNLADRRYTQHAIFNDQIDVADAIVFSHMDCYSDKDDVQLSSFCQQKAKKAYFATDPMALSLESLDIGLMGLFDSIKEGSIDSQEGSLRSHNSHNSHNHKKHSSFAKNQAYYVKEQDGMKVAGWCWPDSRVFSEEGLRSSLLEIVSIEGVYRVKGVFRLIEGQGLFINASRGELMMELSPWVESSRFEVIGLADSVWDDLIKVMCERLI